MRPRIDRHLDRARRRFSRVTPQEAAAELAQAALLVDIRNEMLRRRDGAIPGAIAIDRTTLEWRLDPTSPWRIPQAQSVDTRVILVCAEGYSSSLAVTSLMAIGLRNVTDVIGGFQAWQSANLPIDNVMVVTPD